MADQTTRPSGGPTDVTADMSAAGERLAEEGRALSGTMGEAKDAVAAEARDLKDRAVERLGTEAEGVKEEAVAGLSAFSDALRSASDELSGKNLGLAGDMVRQAAGGLEGFARALQGRSPAEMLDGVRAFGRENPVGFIAGSILAGFALGRFAAVLPTGSGGSRYDYGGSARDERTGASGAGGYASGAGYGARYRAPGTAEPHPSEHAGGMGSSSSAAAGSAGGSTSTSSYGSGTGSSAGSAGLGTSRHDTTGAGSSPASGSSASGSSTSGTSTPGTSATGSASKTSTGSSSTLPGSSGSTPRTGKEGGEQ